MDATKRLRVIAEIPAREMTGMYSSAVMSAATTSAVASRLRSATRCGSDTSMDNASQSDTAPSG